MTTHSQGETKNKFSTVGLDTATKEKLAYMAAYRGMKLAKFFKHIVDFYLDFDLPFIAKSEETARELSESLQYGVTASFVIQRQALAFRAERAAEAQVFGACPRAALEFAPGANGEQFYRDYIETRTHQLRGEQLRQSSFQNLPERSQVIMEEANDKIREILELANDPESTKQVIRQIAEDAVQAINKEQSSSHPPLVTDITHEALE